MRRLAALAASLAAIVAQAQPRLPTNDAEVLERLPTRSVAMRGQERIARDAIARDARNVRAAVSLAEGYLALARVELDPRRLGQAQAVLAPWWSEPSPPQPVLMLRARIRQANHQFVPAIQDMRVAVRRDPADAQAWLMLATLQQVTGELEPSRRTCEELRRRTAALVTAACAAAADGPAARSAAELDAALGALAAAPPHLQAWALGLRAELAERQAAWRAAEQFHRRALVLDPTDAYLRAAYADFLLSQSRPHEVLALIASDTRSDPLLLRRAIAAAQAGAPDARELESAVRARLEASRARGDALHRREEARFALELERAAGKALALALENWTSQKEPADARLVVAAAIAARKPEAAEAVRAWMAANEFDDARIARIQPR